MVALDIYDRKYLQTRTRRIIFEMREIMINFQGFQVGEYFH